VAALASILVLALTPGPVADDAPRLTCRACVASTDDGAAAASGQREVLRAQIDDLNIRARGINVQWPGLAVVLLYVGVGNAPSLIAWFVFKYAVTLPGGVFTWLSPTLLISGIVGASCLVGAILLGVIWQAVQRSRREELIHEREGLELQLEQTPLGNRERRPLPTTWLAGWRF
jgi:hypothetical protein